MTEQPERDEHTDRMSAIQSARELSDAGKHDEALDVLRLVQPQYASEAMQAKVEYLIALIGRRKEEDPEGLLHAPDEEDPSATRRIRRPSG